ncbi:MAG TPA: HAMP domain-containing sensor histidine kinase [Aggregatilineaceae bacterium]|nr:HAMP domain-containing sensor histidine kinase [Aggregatilineaceae bacterium]
MKITIRRRLMFTFTLVILVGGLALFLAAGRQLSRATLEFYRHDLETEAVTLSSGLSEVISEYGDEEEDNGSQTLQLMLQRAQTDDREYTVLDRNRRVLATTGRYQLFEQFPDSSHIERVLRGQTHHWEQGDTAYTATPLSHEGQLDGILLVSAPMAPAYADARRAWMELGAASMPILVLALGASWWLGKLLSRPIQELRSSVLRLAGGELNEHIDVKTRDEIGELGRAFNFMAERLNILINAQRSFISNAAHELRNPLMTLKLRIEALQQHDLSPTQQQMYLNEAAQEIEHMAQLVTQLLALARLDEGRYPAEAETFDLVALLHDLTRQWRIRAAAASLHFDAEISASLPDIPIAVSDIRIILDNLFSNAVKYTSPGGQIYFCVTAETQSVRFEVKDTGAGFAPENAERLFERFFRTDEARSIPGQGLGLAIVRSLVKHYGGTITAASDGPGLGAAFTLALPVLV